MRYVEFGQTDLVVSEICLGTWQAGGDWGAPQGYRSSAASAAAMAPAAGVSSTTWQIPLAASRPSWSSPGPSTCATEDAVRAFHLGERLPVTFHYVADHLPTSQEGESSV